MADSDIIIGRVINITGAIGVLSEIILFFSGIVLLVFRRGFGFDIANSFHWFGSWIAILRVRRRRPALRRYPQHCFLRQKSWL